MHHAQPNVTVSMPLDLNNDGIPDMNVSLTKQLTEKEMAAAGFAYLVVGCVKILGCLGCLVTGIGVFYFWLQARLADTVEIPIPTLTGSGLIDLLTCACLVIPILLALALTRKNSFVCGVFLLFGLILPILMLLCYALYYAVNYAVNYAAVYFNLNVFVVLIASLVLFVTWRRLFKKPQSGKAPSRKVAIDPERELARQKKLFLQAKRAAAARRQEEEALRLQSRR